MEMQKRKCFLLVALLLASLTMGFMVTSIAAASDGKVSIQHDPITIDGDPSDWNGTAGADNTWAISEGEGIWNDIHNDDTGNGSYVYPNGTHEDILDSNGRYTPGEPVEWQAWIYTGWPHGGMVDLREFRVTGNTSHLFMMFRIENMGNQKIAVEWNKDVHGTSGNYQYANATGFGKILIQVYIDQDMQTGSGRTNATMLGNFNFTEEFAWDAVVSIAGDIFAGHGGGDGKGFPRVEFANGTVNVLNDTVASTEPLQPRKTVYIQANCSMYPACIELAVPKSMIGVFAGETWRFAVLVGGYDEGKYRSVDATGMAFFRFMGGEDYPGYDPNIIDLAFTASQSAQEALLDSFTGSSGVELGATAFHAVQFAETGDVVPWVPLLTIPIALIALVIAKRKLKLSVAKHQ